jgi:hypothetical protein
MRIKVVKEIISGTLTAGQLGASRAGRPLAAVVAKNTTTKIEGLCKSGPGEIKQAV